MTDEAPAPGYRIFIGCAAYRDLDAHTASSQLRVGMMAPAELGCEDIALALQMGYHAPRNVETLAQHAVQGGFTHLLYHDADIEYQPRHVARIVETMKALVQRGETKGVVGAMYPSSSGVQTLVGKPDPSDNGWTRFQPGMIGRVLHCGFGFVLIPTSIFADLPRPWFNDEWTGVAAELKTPDVRFCEQAQALGWTIYADTGLDVNHWVRMPLNLMHSITSQAR